MAITASQTRYLRGLAHDLKPVVMVGGKGVTTTVLAELTRALEIHELVKVAIADDDRQSRAAAGDELARATGANIVQRIGKIVILFKRNPDEPRIALPR